MMSMSSFPTNKIEGLLRTRARAAAIGDRGVVRACNVELANLGYQDDPDPASASDVTLETAAATAPPETTVRSRARTRKPADVSPSSAAAGPRNSSRTW